MRTSVLLSIKPIFAEAILSGSKRYEFRRSLFKREPIKKVFMYASKPIARVVGEFTIEDILALEPNKLWERTRDYSGIGKDYFYEYFNGQKIGYAIKIGKTKRYKKQLELDDNFNIKYPPQSFMYVHR